VFKRKQLHTLDESELIKLAKKDTRGFEELYKRNFEFVFRFLFKRLSGNEDLTNELTQKTFLKAMGAIGNYQDRGYAFSTWLIRIAQNEANMFYRSSKKHVIIELTEIGVKPLLREVYDSSEFKDEHYEVLIDMLNKLPDDQSDLIELRFLHEMSFKKIADIYSITEANAKMKVYRIIEKLRKIGGGS
jgi:RNA polymerase sigma-70 factor (ECF subfamily)